MQGRKRYEQRLFTMVNLEEMIPENHLLVRVDRAINLDFIYELTSKLYCSCKRLMAVLCYTFFASSSRQYNRSFRQIRGRRFGRILRVHTQKPFKFFYTLFQFNNLVFKLLYICVLVYTIPVASTKNVTIGNEMPGGASTYGTRQFKLVLVGIKSG